MRLNNNILSNRYPIIMHFELCENLEETTLTDRLLSFVLVNVAELDVAPSTSDESF